jgi:probable F420-dependent oxidoreductase
MKFGVCIPNYGDSLSLDTMTEVALEAENLGYDSIWTTDHVLMSRRSGTPYEKIFDSIATLCYMAAQTKKVKLGISSLIVAMRNPAVVAKQLASLDNFSQGRVILAIGVGWNEKEFSTLGSNFHNRGRRVDESIEIIRALWKGQSSFRGKYHDFDDVVFEPRPISKNLEIWIGGTSAAAMKRATDLGDAWHPNVMALDKFRTAVAEFRAVAPNARDKKIRVRIALNPSAKGSEISGPQGDKRLVLSSDMKQNHQVIHELEELGVDYALVVPSADGKAERKDQIEALRLFAGSFLD